MGIRADIFSMVQDFIRNHEDGKEPTKIHLTPDDEQSLASMSEDEAGGAVSGNVRENWKTIDGVEVVWDATHRHCE